jgi:hypothetical protein
MTMATKHHTSKSRPARNPESTQPQSASTPPKPASGAPNLQSLEDIIEDERARLMKAHSILSCVVAAMEDDAACSVDAPYWPSVIESALDLLDESIRRLEDLDYSPKSAARKSYEVREPAPDYWSGGDWESAASQAAAESADIVAARQPLLKTH